MKQRGRKSSAEMATVTAMPLRMMRPPDHLTEDQCQEWALIAATKEAGWWNAGNAALLEQLCKANVESRRIGRLVEATGRALEKDESQLGAYERLRKIQSSLTADIRGLSRDQRLTQQSQYRADKAATVASRSGGSVKPWDHDVIEG